MDRLIERIAERVPDRLYPIWEISRRLVVDSLRDRVPGLAAEAAFFSLLAMVPMLLVIVGTAGLVAKQFGQDTLDTLQTVILTPAAAMLTTDAFINFRVLVVETLASGQGRIISIGFLFALWAGSRAIATYLKALGVAYDVEDGREPWQQRLLAIGFMLAATLFGTVALPAMVLGPELVQRLLPLDAMTREIFQWTFYPGLIVLSVGVLASFYHLGVPWDTPWRRDLPGAVLAVVLWLVGSYGVRVYAAVSIARSDALYGFLATPLVFLVWLYVTSLAILLGAELNAEIEKIWPHDEYGSRTVPHVRQAIRDRRDGQVPTGGPS
ncbi:MAG: YihY/virulence factor BrkB family protein [Actinobacteria bacterium]|nr:YihY/virulence factor BrkB family protein [Actinomycetota bacterium]